MLKMSLGLVGSGFPHHGSHGVGAGSGRAPPGDLADVSVHEEGHSMRCQDEGTGRLLPWKSAVVEIWNFSQRIVL